MVSGHNDFQWRHKRLHHENDINVSPKKALVSNGMILGRWMEKGKDLSLNGCIFKQVMRKGWTVERSVGPPPHDNHC